MPAACRVSRPVFIRQCPDDFVDIYLQIGWDGIEDHYRAHKLTIKRWIEECGGDELKRRRKDAVRTKRFHAARKHLKRGGEIRRDAEPVPEPIVREAAHHLRFPQNGGWCVFPTQRGDWFVGQRHMSPGEVVEMAVAKGFDPTAVTLDGDEG